MGKKKKPHVPVRLNVLFFIVFLLFSVLILRLGVVQIVQGEEYQKKLEQTVNVSAKIDAPRGIIYDRYGNLVVDNELVLSVTYTNRNTSNEEKLRVATRLNDFIHVDPSNITERDMKDYWILTRPDKVKDLVSREEISQLDNDSKKIYRLQLDRITPEMLAEISDEEMEVLAIKREFDRGYAHSPQRVKVDVTYEEAAKVLEHLSELPGVDILRDSKRHYLFDNTFMPFIGNVGQIPREQIDGYIAKGYDRSDFVGTSMIEQQYEDVLRGKKAVLEHVLDGSRKVIDAPQEKLGERGKDLVLTIDMELQKAIDEIVEAEVNRLLNSRSYLNNEKPEAYVVMMEPNTGEILAISGYGNAVGNIFNQFEMGSTVKGATVLAAFAAGVAKPGTYFYDRPITIGTTRKSTFGGASLGRINDLKALERSSNVYMFEIGMALGNYDYNSKRGGGLQDRTVGFNKARYYFNQFGLGVKTGIDVPTEGTGYNGGVQQLGNLLDYMIGQFDTYTPLQMAQYVSTIANGGYRIQPRFVKEIRNPSTIEGELGNVIRPFSPNVINRVDMTDEYIKRVQEGFRLVVHGSQGTGRGLASKSYRLAGKTGTAQVRMNGVNGTNQTFVGYAPYDDPEIAIAVIVPNVHNRDSVGRPANTITDKSLEAYFNLKNNPRSSRQSEEDE